MPLPQTENAYAYDRTTPSSGKGSSLYDDEENIQSMSLANYHAFTSNRQR